MAEIKKQHISEVLDEKTIVMRFDKNPNIPSYKCNDATYEAIKNKMKKQAKLDKLKKIVDSELKDDDKIKSSNDDFGMMFTLQGL